MAISGLTYIAGDKLFAVDERGTLHGSSASLGAFTSPVAVGHLSAPTHRIYVAAGDGTITQFRGVTIVQNTFATGQAMLWSLADANGILYVGTGTLATPGQGSVIALDDSTGTVLWTHPLPGPAVWPASIAFSGTTPERLIVGTGGPDFRLHALNLTDGSEVWNEPGYAFGQAVVGNGVFYADIGANSLCARSVADGHLIWKHENTINANFNRPIVVPLGGNEVVFATSQGAQAIALDARTGAVKWLTTASGILGVPVTARDASGNVALVIFAIDQFQATSVLQARNAQTGAVVWTSTTNVGAMGSSCTDPLLIPGNADTELVQVGTPDGRLVSLRAYSGQLAWQVPLTNSFPVANSPTWIPW